jgi:glycine/D-amino acid oxidase-like deaminating enzyme
MTPPWPRTPPTSAQRAAYADAVPRSFWVDSLDAREPEPRLEGVTEADLCIVGGGYTGLWAALHAVRRNPSRTVVIVEADRCGEGASGRNGGFLDGSLTHGLGNGLSRFPDEMATLARLGSCNFEGLVEDVERVRTEVGIDAELEQPGYLAVAHEPHELAGLEEEAELVREYGGCAEVLSGEAVRAQVHSPTYLGAVWTRGGTALVHPGQLAEGLRRAALAAGVRIYEHSPAHGLVVDGAGVRVACAAGAVRCRRVLLATSAYPPLLGAMRRQIAPVYDYVLMTEPLSPEQMASIGWEGRQGIDDGANQFHYYRLSRDGRILFGGYDAVYRYGGPVSDRFDVHDATFARLSQHFFTVFPQLAGVRFSHRWGGAIDTCSRFSVCFGNALDGRVVWAAGYTGLGVGATRWGAEVALDLLDGNDTEATRLRFVRTRPLPFPPEPLRSAVIQLTRNRLAAADLRQGRRGLWLGTLDRLGLGFDS